MGLGSYDVKASIRRSKSANYANLSQREVFQSSRIHEDLDPKGVKLRESRDSNEHPESVPVIIAFDVTGSMGHIPHEMIANGLNKMMATIEQAGINHVQILFMAVGDHLCDSAPLQVAQFETDDELLDKWLKLVYLESGGGGNGGESYFLPWFFAGMNTSIDSFEKRNKKGFLFTIGDENIHDGIEKPDLQSIVNSAEKDYTATEMLAIASKKYEVYHLDVRPHSFHDKSRFKELLGERYLTLESHKAVADTITNILLKNVGNQDIIVDVKQEEKPSEIAGGTEIEIM